MHSLNSLVWREITAHTRRSLLTVLAITLGVALLLAASIIGLAASKDVNRLAEPQQQLDLANGTRDLDDSDRSTLGLSEASGLEPISPIQGNEAVVGQVTDPTATFNNAIFVQVGLLLSGLIMLLVAGFVIFNAFAMGLTGRRREIGALRTLGVSRSQVRRLVLGEALLLGTAGTGIGLLAGLGLSWPAMRLLGTLHEAPFSVPWWGLVASVFLGLTVTLASALQPAWRAGQVPPIVAVQGQPDLDVGQDVGVNGRLGLRLLALTMLGLAAFGLVVQPDITLALPAIVLGQVMLLTAAFLALPALVGAAIRRGRPLLIRWGGTTGRLAADNLERSRRRTLLTVGALAAGLTMITATSSFMAAGLKGAFNRLDGMLPEDVFFSADLVALIDSGEFTLQNFSQFITREDPEVLANLNQAAAALQPLQAADLLTIERNRFFALPDELAIVPGAPGIFVDLEPFLSAGGFDFFEGDAATALAWREQGPIVLLQPLTADRQGVTVGNTIVAPTPAGPVAFTVAGIGGSGWNTSVLDYADGERFFNIGAPTHVGLFFTNRQKREETLAQVQAALAPFPNLSSQELDVHFEPLFALVDRVTLLLDGLLMVAVVVAALGVTNTMFINISERRREIALLRAVGATAGQVRRMVLLEAVVIGLSAATIATFLGLLLLLAFGLVILPNGTEVQGIRSDWTTIRLVMGAGLRDGLLASAAAFLFGPLVAGLAAYYPAREASRANIISATRG